MNVQTPFPPPPWFYYVANPLLRTLYFLLLKMDIRNLERVPRDGPLVIAISHSTFLDPPIVCAYCAQIGREVIPITKVEAFDYFILGGLLHAYGAFPIRRGEADVAAFKTALRILNSGKTVVIAPEGHRSESGALQRGREGAIILSLRTGAPILPVAIWGGKQFWKNLGRFQRTDVKMYIGDPVMPITKDGKASRDEVNHMSDELMIKIAQMMPPELHGYYTGKLDQPITHLQPYIASKK